VDADKINFPLILRKWHSGDFFHPLGMENSKKLSDFFVDNKFSIHQKENTWLLCSGQDIIWVVGHRLDNRYKIESETQRILVIKLMD
ncbi:MAG: tRNA lysidine(34) synthetase TilS, partial [Bacteroidales bacterium]